MMKNTFLIFFLSVASFSFSQTINDYAVVIIPLRYDFQIEDNQYRLQTLTKINLEKVGFQAFYANESALSTRINRCNLLYIDVKKESSFLVAKLYLTFKDCYGAEIYRSEIGKSREKAFAISYKEALNNAFESVYALKYSYNNKSDFSAKTAASAINTKAIESSVLPQLEIPNQVTNPIPVPTIVELQIDSKAIQQPKSIKLLYAQKTNYGFQLIDSDPKVVLKMYQTSVATTFIAKNDTVNGVLIFKDNQWFLEYYQHEALVSEQIEIKF
jgi:hypothetical protein